MVSVQKETQEAEGSRSSSPHRMEGWDQLGSKSGASAFASRIAVVGPRGSGKTSMLIDRAAHFVSTGEGVLFICANSAVSPNRSELDARRPMQTRNERSARPGASLVTTWVGLAKAVYGRHGGERQVLSGHDEQLLLGEVAGCDPKSLRAQRLGAARRAFVLSWLGPEELRTHAEAANAATGWEDVIDVATQFADRARARGAIDTAQLMIEATLLLRLHTSFWQTTFPHLIVDDYESATFAEHRLLTTLRSPAQWADSTSDAALTLAVAGNPHGPTWNSAWRSSAQPESSWLGAAAKRYALDTTIELAPRNDSTGGEQDTHASAEAAKVTARTVHHRSLFAPTVAREVQQLLQRGYAPHEIAVVMPHADGSEAAMSSLRSAAHRLGVPLRSWLSIGDDPVCAAALHEAETRLHACSTSAPNENPPNAVSLLLAYWNRVASQLLGFTGGFEGPATPIRPASSVSAHIFSRMVAKVHASIAAGVSPSAALHGVRHERHRDRYGVEVLTDSQTRGREWKALVITGFEEGTRPPRPIAIPKLDHELLNGPDTPSESERNQYRTAEARARVENLFARAIEEVVAISAPQPGVLVSRFLESLPSGTRADSSVPKRPSYAEKRSVRTPIVTENSRAFWAERTVRGSASSLDTFLNCPLEYTYKYVLGVSTPTGPSALVGTITHDILEDFFHPDHAHERTEARLFELFEKRWDDNEFMYRAQAVEYRKTVRAMLDIAMERERSNPATVIAVEHPFEVPFGDYQLSGKIDRIDRLPGSTAGGTGGLAITDYKTGNRKNKSDAEDSLQLAVYGIAARHDTALRTQGELRELALYFLKEGEFLHQSVTTDHEQRWSATITEAFAAIADGQSDPSPTANCEYCSFERVCPTRVQGRVVE